jgi:hypothetical protein
MGKYRNSKNRICKETIKLQEKSPKNEWWDEECKQAIKQKNMASTKYLQQNTKENKKHYKEKRKQANKVCKQKNKQWFKNKIMQITNKINETKKFFEEVKYFNQQQLTLPTSYKDSENNIISQTKQVLKRWREWFYIICNPKRH